MDRAPGRACAGSVDRSGRRYVKAIPPCRPAAPRRSRWRRVVANGPAGATPTASSPCARPRAARSATRGTRRGGRTRTVGTGPSCRSPWRRATPPSVTRPAAVSAGATHVPRGRQEACVRQHAEGPRLRDIDDDRLAGLARADEGHQAVVAAVGVLHGTVVAVDAQDALAGTGGTGRARQNAVAGIVGTGHERLLGSGCWARPPGTSSPHPCPDVTNDL